jgi:hypothetical protein
MDNFPQSWCVFWFHKSVSLSWDSVLPPGVYTLI